LLPFRWQPAA